MGLALYYETLIVVLASVLTAAVCLSSYLVCKHKTMLYACIAFLFYFFDVSSVLQDEVVLQANSVTIDPTYLFVRSLLTLVTGAGFLTAFWLMTCEYLGVDKKALRYTPPIIFLVASLILLIISGQNLTLRFFYYTCRAVFMFWILLYGAVSYFKTRDEIERQRLGRYKVQCSILMVIGIAMVIEDAIFFLVLTTETITIGPLTLSAERNYAENLLIICCAAMTANFALRQLNIRASKSPIVDDTRAYRQTAEDVIVYAQRHQLTAREQEVLSHILRDQDNQNIASSMNLSPSTVKVHVHNILQKTGMANRHALIQDFWKTV